MKNIRNSFASLFVLATVFSHASFVGAESLHGDTILLEPGATTETELAQGEIAKFPVGEMAEVSIEQNRPPGSRTTRNAEAPPCVVATKEKGFVQVQNNCNTDVRVKVILAFSTDTGCKTVVAGTRTNIGFAGTKRIDSVVLC